MAVPEKTHTGNLNRTKVPANPQMGVRGSKSNDTTATLRAGSLPKSETVRTVDRDANKGKAKKIAQSNPNGNPKTVNYGILNDK